ncbi:thiamine pyrophosphate-dependent dehydrogenase E1 component subunit alpha [Bacillus alkalicellulosilyticus]|uniref:thiamine pyrophosphate-dependent dehydrogenase E1 component subunit alpha n=1 Tax=Alkalihalobacterium alkalicellulosilyticum TaxID=1912214 RepID=UPI000998DE44|nr:thiamine pyrophosphate-dependent dehydrogenase E1 component subunit alpha [Bacillus alkalicellulosilyticus]
MTNRHKSMGLTDEFVLKMYEMMLLARRIDERMWLLNRAGKIPFVVSCQGQEAAQVGAAFALDLSKDYVLPYYRDMGVVLTFGMTARDLMLSAFAKAEDPNSGGRQMPGHFGQRKNRIVTGSSPVTTQVPHAAGIALGAKMEGKDFVTFTTFGEGSSNQGDFHEGINFASVHKLPAIFMCENNKYAISVPYDKQVACKNISDRAIGYGIPGVTVDGNDPLAVYEAVHQAANRARAGEGPTLVETVSYRLTPHSSDDDDKTYRSQDEVDEAKKKDALFTFAMYLKETGVLTPEVEEELENRIRKEIDEATEYGENAPFPAADDLFKHIFAE